MGKFRNYVLLICALLLAPKVSFAVLPPDVILSTGSQMVQFFSVAALGVTMVFSFIVLVLRQFLWLTKQYAWAAIAMIMSVSMAATTFVYLSETEANAIRYRDVLAGLQNENAILEQLLSKSYSPEQIAQFVEDCKNRTEESATTPVPGNDLCATGALFFSTTVSLYGTHNNQPFVLQVDLNRLEEVKGAFTQYFFLNGTAEGDSFADYVSILATSAEPLPAGFLSTYKATQYADLSTRYDYDLTILLKDKPLTIALRNLTGDFITRDSIYYMRFQSVGNAVIAYDGETFTADALVESTASIDYTKQIFFPGHKVLKAETYQFILWDDRGNYYMVDDTQVDTPVAAYPSHTWLLYKNAITGATQKSYTANIRHTATTTDAAEWVISIPEFATATVAVQLAQTFKQEETDRIRGVVTGIIEDAYGRRKLRGIVHWIKNEDN